MYCSGQLIHCLRISGYKNNLRTIWGWSLAKNLRTAQVQPKVTGSYKKKRVVRLTIMCGTSVILHWISIRRTPLQDGQLRPVPKFSVLERFDCIWNWITERVNFMTSCGQKFSGNSHCYEICLPVAVKLGEKIMFKFLIFFQCQFWVHSNIPHTREKPFYVKHFWATDWFPRSLVLLKGKLSELAESVAVFSVWSCHEKNFPRGA